MERDAYSYDIQNQNFSELQNLNELIDFALDNRNLLLLDQLSQYYLLTETDIPNFLEEGRKIVSEEVKEGKLLRWFDVDLIDDEELSSIEKQKKKIQRTIRQIENLQNGSQLMCSVIVPALNEETFLPDLLQSVHLQKTNYPVSVIVADNGSQDRTVEVALEQDANVVHSETRGIGPARATGLRHALEHSNCDLEKLLIFQTDADSMLEGTNVLESIGQVYENDPSLLASVGETIYEVMLPNGEKTMINSGKKYKEALGTTSFREYFLELEREIDDYLQTEPYYYMIGPNTVYRASVFTLPNVQYPEDGSWESLIISIRLQQQIPSSLHIKRLNEQRIKASGRGFINEDGRIDEEKSKEIKKKGFVPPSKATNSTLTPLQTMKQLLTEIDRELYQLKDDEEIVAVVDSLREDSISINIDQGRIVPRLNAGTKKRIEGSYYMIAKKHQSDSLLF